MKSNHKIKGIWVAVIFGCAVFLLFQYFMVGANKQALTTEDAEGVSASFQEQKVETQEQKIEKGDIERLPQVDAYLRFVSQNNPEEKGIFDNNYTKSAFNHLTDALKDLAEQEETNMEVQKIETLKNQFDQYEQAEENSRPKQLRNILMATTGIMEALHVEENNALKGELEELLKSAHAIDENTPIEKQSDRVEEYFEQAALVLEEIEDSV